MKNSIEVPTLPQIIQQEVEKYDKDISTCCKEDCGNKEPHFHWEDMLKFFESALRRVAEQTIEAVRVGENEEIDCPLSVCCSSCYSFAVNDRLDKILAFNPEER